MDLMLSFLWTVVLYIVGLVLGVAIAAAIQILPTMISNWLRKWRDRNLQGQGCVVLRRHRARLVHTS